MIAINEITQTPPEDAESLQRFVVDLIREKDAQIVSRDEVIALRDATIERLTRQAERLQEQLNLAIAKRYGARSEKSHPGQGQLFDEAECAACFPEIPAGMAEVAGDEAADTTVVPAHTRQKPGRRPLPAALPRVDIVHELPETARICPHDGQVMTEIGEEITEQLDIIPATIQVLRHMRKKYACACGVGVHTVPLPPQPLRKTMASPGLLAHIVVSKYQDALPLYRQETILQRIGVDLPRATLSGVDDQGRRVDPTPDQPDAGSAPGL